MKDRKDFIKDAKKILFELSIDKDTLYNHRVNILAFHLAEIYNSKFDEDEKI